jgi:uncharacterized membrane protein YhaH (DUF805 family)
MIIVLSGKIKGNQPILQSINSLLQSSNLPAVVFLFISIMMVILIFIWSFMASIKRLHDLNRSGYFSALLFVPMINILLLGEMIIR